MNKTTKNILYGIATFAGFVVILAVVRSLRGQPGIATLSVSSSYATVKTNIVIK